MKKHINYYIICNNSREKMKREKTVRQTNGNSKNRNPPFLKVIFSLSVDIMKVKTQKCIMKKTEEKNNEKIPKKNTIKEK